MSGVLKLAMALLEGQELDILIIEGHPGVDMPMVYAARDDKIQESKPIDKNVVCIVSLSPENFEKTSLPVFHTVDDVSLIADMVLEELERSD